MPPRSLVGTLFAAAAVLWWLLVGVLLTLAAPASYGFRASFWIGGGLMGGAGYGWGSMLGHALLRRRTTEGRTARGLVRFAVLGVALLMLAGATTLLAAFALSALAGRAAFAWAALRQLGGGSTAALALVGAPVGAAAGVVLRALAAPADEAGLAPNGSHRSPPR